MGHKLCIYAILSHKTPKKGKNSKITKNFNFERTEKYANHQKVPMFCQIRVQRTKIYNTKKIFVSFERCVTSVSDVYLAIASNFCRISWRPPTLADYKST